MKKFLKFGLLFIVLTVALTGCGNGAAKLNKTVDIESDSIKITVLGSEQVTVDDSEFSSVNGEYIKVKLSIENYGNETYGWSTLDFKLGDEIASFGAVVLPDLIKIEIASGETETGYIYFPVTDSDELTYTATNLTDKATFKIK